MLYEERDDIIQDENSVAPRMRTATTYELYANYGYPGRSRHWFNTVCQLMLDDQITQAFAPTGAARQPQQCRRFTSYPCFSNARFNCIFSTGVRMR